MLTLQELEEIKEYVLRELPRALEQDPKFVTFIEGILSEKFPRRDEFAQLLDEMRQLREESQKHFNVLENRFEQVDQRFEQMDQRFEQMDQRFEQMDQRFEQVDQRFEQVDQRFEQVDQRFDKVEQRLDNVEREVHTLRTDMTQQMSDLRTDLTQRMDGLQKWVELTVGGFQDRAGKNLEKVVAGALQFGLKRPDIKEEHIKLRHKIYDPTGLVYKAGKQKEVDIVATNGEYLVFEVKSGSKAADVDDFADKVELLRLQNPDKQVNAVFIALGADEYVQKECERHNISLIPESTHTQKKRKP